MTLLWKAAGALLLACILSVLLKRSGGEGGGVAAIGAVLAAVLFLGRIGGGLLILQGIADDAGIPEGLTAPLKAIGICFIGKVVCDVCDSFGEKLLSGAAETVTKGELFLLTVPYVQKIFELAKELFGA